MVSRDPQTREVTLRLYRLLTSMDAHMSRRGSAQLAWQEISASLGLASTQGKSITELGLEAGRTKQAVSRHVTAFLRMSGLSASPAFGLKSLEAKKRYQLTNGLRDPA